MDRLQGYKNALQEANLDFKEDFVHIMSGYDVQDGYDAAVKMLNKKEKPDALFVFGDMAACGALRAFAKMGIKVPEDISVIGYDDSAAHFSTPRLTTVAQPLNEIGKIAVRLALRKSEGTMEGLPQKILLPPKLIQGETVKLINKM